jgi:hypothetical protein
MLTMESLKAKQVSGNLETDIHATLLPETITCSFWNLGCPSNTVEPGDKFLHNTGSPAFMDNEQENPGNNFLSPPPPRMRDPMGRMLSDCLQEDSLLQTCPCQSWKEHWALQKQASQLFVFY